MAELNLRAGIGMTSQRTRVRMIERLKELGIVSPLVLEAMANVPRHFFVEDALQSRAYEDTPLPIGHGQTISSPYTVARTCELAINSKLLEARHAAAKPGTKVVASILEIGGGCGYQAAVLARLAQKVVSIERIAALVGRSRHTLRELRVNNVLTRNADGTLGYLAGAPYDAIVVAAAMPFIPDALKVQLKPGGRLIAPVGQGDVQRLIVVEAGEDGFRERDLEAAKFVPLLPGVS